MSCKKTVMCSAIDINSLSCILDILAQCFINKTTFEWLFTVASEFEKDIFLNITASN